MASSAPLGRTPSAGRNRATAGASSTDSLRRRALEVLTRAIAKAVESASDDTLADIIGSDGDPRHVLSVARKDIAPDSVADLEALKSAREKTARFREEVAERAGGMLDRVHVAAMLGVSPAAIDKQRQRKQILGVPYGAEMRNPAAQFVEGEAVGNLRMLLEAFGDSNPWEQLMLLTSPVEGFGEGPETIFQILARRPDGDIMRQLVGLVSSWAA